MIAKNDRYLIVVGGPTAAGKTDVAIALARHFQAEIISADSRQVYREMKIGTARPNETQLRQAKHHFIANKSVTTLFGAGHFAAEARILLDSLFRSARVVVLVGGSGLYIDALVEGMDDFEEVPAPVREEVIANYKEKGLKWLQQAVETADPAFMKKADRNNSQRLMRALEVFLHTTKPYSDFLKHKTHANDFKAIKIMVTPDRKTLYERINARVDEMVKNGLVEEVNSLYSLRQNNALNTVGYKEIFEYIEGKCTLAMAIEKIKQHTRNYAKRQLTWFRNRGKYEEFAPDQLKKIIQYAEAQMA